MFRQSLGQIFERRVGREVLVEKLEAVSHLELYVRAAQRPQLSAKAAAELVLDQQFTKTFRNVECEQSNDRIFSLSMF